ncbi:hypothetical protein SAMN05920897_11122 [Alkalispirochaeta americana]|uniref:Uncharacterized protein n=1 Tax=Alkalispirochaeta americana TaxID=159291 RepID=A0A1N6TWE5_9SPIO|nr:hypothetical protein [Alkalispirochaeta americana]SIQ57710.1 hypothetical protein SAMN05920897_11122 [Alkalispirochaeta americana]
MIGLMTQLDQFETTLAELLELRRRELEEALLPELKQCYQQMRINFEAIHTAFKKKGLIKPDPYNYEERISELDVPSDQPFLESDRDRELAARSDQYLARLIFLTDYYEFSLEYIDLRRLKSLVRFTRYIKWESLSETATQPTTRGLGENAAKLKRGGDQLSANIVADAQDNLAQSCRKALTILRQLTAYQRENYKLELRREVLPSARIAESIASPDQAVKQIRIAWQRKMGKTPFVQELVQEVLTENSPDAGPATREALLASLQVKQEQKETRKQQAPDLKDTLLEAIRALAGGSSPLESMAQKLTDNALILQSKKLGIKEFLHQVWDRLRGKDEAVHIYTVDYLDEQSQTRKSEDIRFEDFVNTLSRRARVYNGFLARSGNAWNRLIESNEEELLQFATRDMQEMQVVLRRCESLDTFLRASLDREQRKRLRGISAELVSLKETLQRARKKTHEYVAKYEEQQQLRRLGISPDQV